MPGMTREPGANPGRSGHCECGAAPDMPLGFKYLGRREARYDPRVRIPS